MPPYKLKKWIKLENLDWDLLTINTNAIDLLYDNQDKINWNLLASNINALELIENNKDKILKENKDFWNLLSGNTSFSAIKLLEKYPDKINWNELSSNPSAINILEKNLDKINWMVISKNHKALHLLEQNKDKIDWNWLSENPNAIHILESNITKIDWYAILKNPNALHLIKNIIHGFNPYLTLDDSWNPKYICYYLSQNTSAIDILEKQYSLIDWKELSRNTKAIELLGKNLDKLDWNELSGNPCAIKLLEQNQNKIHWKYISLNENIFEIDYYYIKKRIEPFIEELMMVCFHPCRVEYYIEKYHYEIVQGILKLIISTTLMIKFNPIYPKLDYSQFDKKVVFSSGVFLFLTILNDLVTYFTDKFNVKKQKIRV